MKYIFLFFFSVLSLYSDAQTFIHDDSDTTLIVEYRNGLQWAYREHNNLIIDVSNVAIKDEYGKYYQLNIYIKNIGDRTILFQPENITSNLILKNNKEKPLLVYTYDSYMRRIERKQEIEQILSSFAIGLNAGMAGYKTANVSGWNYKTGFYSGTINYYDYGAAAAAQIQGYSYISDLERKHNGDQVIKSQGYLRITSIRPGEEIFGHINIKKKKGKSMTVNIPIGNYIYNYNWNLQKEF